MKTGGAAVYRALVRLYPREFRDEFADDMATNFHDLVADRGSAAAWRRVVVDLAVTVPRYRLETVMTSRRANTTIIGIVALLAVGACAVLMASFTVVAIPLLIVAVVLAIANRSNLARSVRPESSDSRRRARICSAIAALVAIGTLAVGMIDLGGQEHWSSNQLLVYNVLFLGAAVTAIVSLLFSLRRPHTA